MAGGQRTTTTTAVISLVAIAGILLACAAVGYLVTTFLFAFSGGQYRMVAVVNVGALAVIGVGALTAGIAWFWRSPRIAIICAAAATFAGWILALIGEWILSFFLGAR